MSIKWLDIQDIAVTLEEQHPDVNIGDLSLTKLRQLVINLPKFDDDSNGSSERILEAIQMAWSEEREG